MSAITTSLILILVFNALIVALMVTTVVFFPESLLGPPAKAVLNWLPPFLGGPALRDWATRAAEQLAQKRLAGRRTGETACQLAVELEDAAMHAMLPLAEPAELERVVACPETGQGRVGVTVPEVLAIAAYIRKNMSRVEQDRLHKLAVENAKTISTRASGNSSPYHCALQGADDVCRVFARRPLRCRPLHALSVISARSRGQGPPACLPDEDAEAPRHEEWVADGIEIGLRRALKSASLDANLYELNSALATVLGTSDAAERWARGENVIQGALSWRQPAT